MTNMMIQLKGINKTYFNGAPLHVLERHRPGDRKGEMVSIMGHPVREIDAVEHTGDFGYFTILVPII